MSRAGLLAPLLLSACGLAPYGAPVAAPVEAEEQLYRLTDLRVDPDPTANHLPEALDALDVLLPDQGWSLDGFNATLEDNVANWSAVYVEVHPGSPLHLHISTGEEAYASPLEGELIGQDGFDAGPGDVSLDFVVSEGVAPVPLALLATRATGTFGETLSGEFEAVIVLDRVIDDIVAPAIPVAGYDVDGDGIEESPAAVLDFVRELAPAIGDVTLADGTPGITARMLFDGAPAAED
jgi:hypothetical protein